MGAVSTPSYQLTGTISDLIWRIHEFDTLGSDRDCRAKLRNSIPTPTNCRFKFAGIRPLGIEVKRNLVRGDVARIVRYPGILSSPSAKRVLRDTYETKPVALPCKTEKELGEDFLPLDESFDRGRTRSQILLTKNACLAPPPKRG